MTVVIFSCRFHPLDRLAALVSLQAEEPRKVQAARPAQFLDIEKEDKIRQFSPIDKLFDYFSSYQV